MLMVATGVACVKGIAYYAASTTSMQHTTSTSFTWFCLLMAVILTLSIHQPWLSTHGRITERHALRIIVIAILLAVSTALTIYTLRVIEPIRTSLLEHIDIAIVAALGYLFGRHKKFQIFQFALIAIGSIFLLVWYDPLSSAAQSTPNSSSNGYGLQVKPGQTIIADQFGGVTAMALNGNTNEDTIGSNTDESNNKNTKPTVQDSRGFLPASTSNDDTAAVSPLLSPIDSETVANNNENNNNNNEMGKIGRRLQELGAVPPPPNPIPEPPIPRPAPPSPIIKPPTGTARTVLAQAGKVRAVMEAHGRSSVFVATIFLGIAAWFNTVRRKLQKQLVADTGVASKCLHTWVLTTALLLWTPITIIRWLFSSANIAPGTEGAAVTEAVAALDGNQVNAKLDAVAAATAATVEAVKAHAGPGYFLFLFTAILYGTIVLVLAEYAVDLPLIGNRAAVVAVLSGGGNNLSSSSGGSTVLPSLSSNAGQAQSPDASIMRIYNMVATFFATVLFSKLCGWGYQNTFLLWFGVLIYIPCIAIAANIDSSQISRVYNALTRGSSLSSLEYSSSSSSSTNNNNQDGISIALRSFVSLLSSIFSLSSSSNQVYSIESGSMVSISSSSSINTFSSSTIMYNLRKVFRHIWEEENSRKIFIFLTINFSFMFVEIIVGYMTNSLGLISDAGHMFFDNASLFIGLYASYMGRWKPDTIFTYGYARYEILAGFVNAIFLVFIAVSIVAEALQRLWEPPEIHGEHLLTVSVMGLGVNIIGLIFFHDVAHSHGGHGHGGGHSHGSHDHSHGDSHGHGGPATNENMHGVYLHVLADALGSVGVIISSLLIKYYGWHLADPVTSIIISGLILVTAGPLVKATIGPLLSRIPEDLEHDLLQACVSIERIPEVTRIEAVHFWKQHADQIVGTMHVFTTIESDNQKILRRVRQLLSNAGVRTITVQIEKDDGQYIPTAKGSTSINKPGSYTSYVENVWQSVPVASKHHGHSHNGSDVEEGFQHGHSHGNMDSGHSHDSGCSHHHGDMHQHSHSHGHAEDEFCQGREEEEHSHMHPHSHGDHHDNDLYSYGNDAPREETDDHDHHGHSHDHHGHSHDHHGHSHDHHGHSHDHHGHSHDH